MEVALTDNGTAVCTAGTMPNSRATTYMETLSGTGAHTIVASYTGNINYAALSGDPEPDRNLSRRLGWTATTTTTLRRGANTGVVILTVNWQLLKSGSGSFQSFMKRGPARSP